MIVLERDRGKKNIRYIHTYIFVNYSRRNKIVEFTGVTDETLPKSNVAENTKKNKMGVRICLIITPRHLVREKKNVLKRGNSLDIFFKA